MRAKFQAEDWTLDPAASTRAPKWHHQKAGLTLQWTSGIWYLGVLSMDRSYALELLQMKSFAGPGVFEHRAIPQGVLEEAEQWLCDDSTVYKQLPGGTVWTSHPVSGVLGAAKGTPDQYLGVAYEYERYKRVISLRLLDLHNRAGQPKELSPEQEPTEPTEPAEPDESDEPAPEPLDVWWGSVRVEGVSTLVRGKCSWETNPGGVFLRVEVPEIEVPSQPIEGATRGFRGPRPGYTRPASTHWIAAAKVVQYSAEMESVVLGGLEVDVFNSTQTRPA